MKIITGIVLLSLALVFSGCATMKPTESLKAEIEQLKTEKGVLTAERDAYRKDINQFKTKLEGLQNSLSQEKQKTAELESKIEALSDELQSLKGTAVYEETSKVAPDVFTKRVQLALYAAGFDPGKIDGKMGPQTIQAIKDFQEANGLKVDGIVGKETWEELQGYLEMK